MNKLKNWTFRKTRVKVRTEMSYTFGRMSIRKSNIGWGKNPNTNSVQKWAAFIDNSPLRGKRGKTRTFADPHKACEVVVEEYNKIVGAW